MDSMPRVLIVTGAHLYAERHDRPLAYGLREALSRRWAELDGGASVVCSDVWSMSRDELRRVPTISVGAPEHNALSAYLGSRLPSVFVVDDVLMVQMSLEAALPQACCWGTSPQATRTAVEAFGERYAEAFVEAIREL